MTRVPEPRHRRESSHPKKPYFERRIVLFRAREATPSGRPFRGLAVLLAMAAFVLGFNLNAPSAQASCSLDPSRPGEVVKRYMFVIPAHLGESGSDREAASTDSNQACKVNGKVNPWGCELRVDYPHESTSNPGAGNINVKAHTNCDSSPPGNAVVTVTQNVWRARWYGWSHEKEKESQCPDPLEGQRYHPDCNWYPRPYMTAYMNWECDNGKVTYFRYKTEASAELTVGNQTYYAYDSIENPDEIACHGHG
jgi:hypothetical protein